MLTSPFGPLIYSSDISEEFLSFLKQSALDSVDGEMVGYDLAGNISSQRNAVLDPNTFIEHIASHVKEYVDGNFKRSNKPEPNSISYNLGNGPWINYQKKHEFNPIHVHGGVLSVVIFIDIPQEIEKEHLQWEGRTTCPSPGMLEFVYGTQCFMANGSYKVTPKTGQMYIFPADLKHCVYPFTSDVTRITMSFNIFNLQFE